MSGRVPSRGSDQFNLRFPDGMRERIAEEAKASNRSMNAEIIARLEASLSRGSSGAVGELLRMLEIGAMNAIIKEYEILAEEYPEKERKNLISMIYKIARTADDLRIRRYLIERNVNLENAEDIAERLADASRIYSGAK